jgi:hypothetical protein
MQEQTADFPWVQLPPRMGGKRCSLTRHISGVDRALPMLTPKSPRCAGLSFGQQNKGGGLPGGKEVHHHRRIWVRQAAHPI